MNIYFRDNNVHAINKKAMEKLIINGMEIVLNFTESRMDFDFVFVFQSYSSCT